MAKRKLKKKKALTLQIYKAIIIELLKIITQAGIKLSPELLKVIGVIFPVPAGAGEENIISLGKKNEKREG